MLKKNRDVLKYQKEEPRRFSFFGHSVLPMILSFEQSCLKLEKSIQHKKEYICQIENYISNAAKPIEEDIQNREEYEKTLNGKLSTIDVQIARPETENKKIRSLGRKKKELEAKLQRTEDLIIEYKQELAKVKAEIEAWKKILPNEKAALHRWQVKLATTLMLSVKEEIEQRFVYQRCP